MTTGPVAAAARPRAPGAEMAAAPTPLECRLQRRQCFSAAAAGEAAPPASLFSFNWVGGGGKYAASCECGSWISLCGSRATGDLEAGFGDGGVGGAAFGGVFGGAAAAAGTGRGGLVFGRVTTTVGSSSGAKRLGAGAGGLALASAVTSAVRMSERF